MPEIIGQQSDVHFGAVNAPPVDWRATPTQEDPDDGLLPITPPDVVALLGFDPLEFEPEFKKDFDPHQPRDEAGRWSSGGGGPDISNEFVHEVKLAVASIDKAVRDKLGVRVRAVKSVKDAYPELEGVKPRGWFSGTWEQADGLYDPEKSQVVVAETSTRDGVTERATRVSGVTRHEYGHAVDEELGKLFKMGKISNSGAFDIAHEQDVNFLLKHSGSTISHNGYSFQNEAARLSYFIQPTEGKRSSAGRSEAFAEAFAALYGGGCSTDNEEFAKFFPRTIRHVADKIKEMETGNKSNTAEPVTVAAAIGGVWYKAGDLDIMRAEGPNGIITDILGK